MPPTQTDEGLVAAGEIRSRHPNVGALVLSQYLASRYAIELLEEHPDRSEFVESADDDRVLVAAELVTGPKRGRYGNASTKRRYRCSISGRS